MFVFRLVAVLAATLALVACSSNDKKEKPAELLPFEPTVGLELQWRTDDGKGYHNNKFYRLFPNNIKRVQSANVSEGFAKKRFNRLFPVIENGLLYTVDNEGQLLGLDLETGRVKWHMKTDFAVSGALSITNGFLYFGTYDGEVVGIDIEAKEVLWVSEVSSEVVAPPASNYSLVLVQTSDSRLFALDAKTGEQKWKYDHVAPVLSLRTTSAPVIVSSQVIAAFDNGQVVSLGLSDGSLLWSQRVAQPKGRSELERVVDIDAHPVVNGAIVYLASYQGNIVAINRGQGQKVWERPESSFSDLVTDGKALYSSSSESKVSARNAYTGDVLWENDALRLRNIGSPILFGEYLAVIDKEGYLHLMNKSDGQFAYRTKSKGKGYASPMLVHQDSLITIADDGRVASYKLKPLN